MVAPKRLLPYFLLLVAALCISGCNAAGTKAVWHAQYDGMNAMAVEQLEDCLSQQPGFRSHEPDPAGIQLNRHHEYKLGFATEAQLMRAARTCKDAAGKGTVLQAANKKLQLKKP